MKTKLLILLLFGVFGVNAQTTHDINWFMGIGTTVDMTIDVGDTVRWTWTDAFSHTVTNSGGSTETFNSGILPASSQYSYTFTMVGVNPYFCGVHGALSMAGTITVQTLGIDDFALKGFSITPNPANSILTLQLPNGLDKVKVEVFDVLGKKIYVNEFTEAPINISSWSRGLYFVKVSSEDIVHTKRFIKQ